MIEDIESFVKDMQKHPDKNIQERQESLKQLDKWGEISTRLAIPLVGAYINYSHDLKEVGGIEEGIEICKRLLERDLSAEHTCLVNYQISNAYHYDKKIKQRESEGVGWDDENLLRQIIHLRQALHREGLEEIHRRVKFQIYTNLGNALDRTGRIVEAIEKWHEVIEASSFPMALGNRGIGKKLYGRALYDPQKKQKGIFFSSAYRDLCEALSSDSLHPTQKERFECKKEQLEPYFSEDLLPKNIEGDSLGESEKEREYRRWCLKNRLFLNPLNDITKESIAAEDTLHLPDMIMDFDENFPFPGFYNQIKQEFVSARYLYYEGLTSEGPHFSDKGVLVYNTLDYPVYSYHAEQMKTGLRMAYSIFDKIAVFLNEYHQLGHKTSSVTFDTIWYKDLEYKNGLKEIFRDTLDENWALKALYWQKKDFYGGPLRADYSEELIGKDLEEIRHHLEHKFLKVHQHSQGVNSLDQDEGNIYKNELKNSISREELEEYTLKMLKLARAALIYLTLAVNKKEISKREEYSDRLTVPIFSDKWEDEWKF